jgi:hypothetical protein
LLKSRGRPANWRGRLLAVWVHLSSFRADLMLVGGYLSPVVAASTIVATASPNADTPSLMVGTARLNVDVSPAAADFASSAAGFSPVNVGGD